MLTDEHERKGLFMITLRERNKKKPWRGAPWLAVVN